MTLIDALQWRHASKKMTGQHLETDKLDFILQATQLSASSYGLQPYKILVIENDELKRKLQAAAWNQPQIVECSHLMVFCIWDKITEKAVAEYIENTAQTRGLTVESMEGYKQYMLKSINNMSEEVQHTWAAKQAYIALGTALAAAAEIKVDSTPMEGFEPEKFDEILRLKEKGLRSVVLCALGYRAPDDRLNGVAKVRRKKELLFEFIS